MSKAYKILRDKIKQGCTEQQAEQYYEQMPQEYKDNVQLNTFIKHCTDTNKTTILWHDYEGWGANPREDQPSQYAAVRTNYDLEIVDVPTDIYCKPSPHKLPNPIAVHITKISPLKCMENGLHEYEFIDTIRLESSIPSTISCAYNGISYDREMTRFTLFRNLLPAYEHEHKNNNGFWDIIMLGALVRAMSPNGINWPKNEEGKPSLRQEHLAQENGIKQDSAHNAVSDVKTLVQWARLLKSNNERLWDYTFEHKSKKKLKQLIKPKSQVLIHPNMGFGLQTSYIAPIIPIHYSNTENDTVVCLDLREDYQWIKNETPEELAELLYSKKDTLESKGKKRPPIVKLKLAKCPIVIPIGAYKDPAIFNRININRQEILERGKEAAADKALHSILYKATSINTHQHKEVDVEHSLYTGGFYSKLDNSNIKKLHDNGITLAKANMCNWDDERIPQLIGRILAKNYPDTLTKKDISRWHAHCAKNISEDEINFNNAIEIAKTEIKDPALLDDYQQYVAHVKQQIS